MHNNYSLSIVLPCYNPIDGWVKTIEAAVVEIQKQNISFELIIVNDGSTKQQVGEDMSVLLINPTAMPAVLFLNHAENRGKGYALREGVKAAKGNYIIYTDIDFPYTHQSFIKIFNSLKSESCDVAVGIRSEEYYTHLPKARVKISKLLRFFVRIFLRIPTDDTQCGLKGFNQKGKEIFLQTTTDRYLFDLEFIFLAARKKLALKTVEVELREGIQLSHMRWNILLQEFGNFLKIFVQSIL